jgi:(p)ppGpp synthase/HD superfamily hydrolase
MSLMGCINPSATKSPLQRAISIATFAHDGQVDKGNQPYILHPTRVMLAGTTEAEMIVGVLHDVVEDTPVTLEFLAQHFPPAIIEAMDALTRRDDETYKGYINRVAESSPLAIRVKLNDIRDNMSPFRMRPLDEGEAIGMFKRYIPSLKQLTTALDKYVTMEVHVDYARNPS